VADLPRILHVAQTLKQPPSIMEDKVMVKAEGNIIINVPVEKVFGLLIDTEKMTDWLPLMMEVHDIQGKGVGKKYKWTYKFIGTGLKA